MRKDLTTDSTPPPDWSLSNETDARLDRSSVRTGHGSYPAQHAPSVPPVEGNAVCAWIAERGDRFSRDGVHMRNPNPVGQVAAA